MTVTHYVKSIIIIAVVSILYSLSRAPSLSDAERVALAEPFSFEESVLPVVDGREARSIRPVHPSLAHISAWVSAVGGAVSLFDIDDDGLPNDVCYVDTARDQVTVAPAPGTGLRYEPFVLDDRRYFDRRTMAPMGVVPGDFNEDGRTDILVYYWGRTPLAFLRIASDGPQTTDARGFAAVEIVEGRQRWFTNAATQADVDGDGHIDLVIGNYYADGSRILDAQADGREEMQSSMSRALNGGVNRVLLFAGAAAGRNPTVRYREAADAFHTPEGDAASGWTLALGAADLNGDLLPELYVANDFGPDRLLHNISEPGRPAFQVVKGVRSITTPRSKVLGGDSFKGMGVDFGDVNGDGELDIYVSNIAEEYALEESHFMFVRAAGDNNLAGFRDVSEPLGLARGGWGWDSRLADFDNDGLLEAVQATGFLRGSRNCWPELHEIAMGNDALLAAPESWHNFRQGDDLSGHTPLRFFTRDQSGRFFDIATEVGIGAPQVSRGIATADVDGDGDLDFAVGNQWELSRFYRNSSPSIGSFLGLNLVLPLVDGVTECTCRPGLAQFGYPSRPAIGAVASVRLHDSRKLIAQVDGGNGHSGVRAPQLHFGLGKTSADAVVAVTIRWRTSGGEVQQGDFQFTPGWHTVALANDACNKMTHEHYTIND